MESIQKVIYWIIDYAKKNNLIIRNETWSQDYSPSLFIYTVKGKIDGISVSGLGTSLASELEAIIKAFSEYLERLYLYNSKYSNSNGLAIHTTPELAKVNARAELIERDSFFFYFYNKIPFKKIEKSLWKRSINNKLSSIIKKVEEKNICINFYQVSSYESRKNIICICDGLESELFGMILGMSYNKKNNYQHAFLEIFYQIVHLINNKVSNHSLEKFNNLKTPTIHDHFLLGLNTPYAKEFKSRYLEDNNSKNIQQTPLDEIQFNSAHFPNNSPFYIARATAKNHFKLHLGDKGQNLKSHPRVINREKFNYDFPHPFS